MTEIACHGHCEMLLERESKGYFRIEQTISMLHAAGTLVSLIVRASEAMRKPISLVAHPLKNNVIVIDLHCSCISMMEQSIFDFLFIREIIIGNYQLRTFR